MARAARLVDDDLKPGAERLQREWRVCLDGSTHHNKVDVVGARYQDDGLRQHLGIRMFVPGGIEPVG